MSAMIPQNRQDAMAKHIYDRLIEQLDTQAMTLAETKADKLKTMSAELNVADVYAKHGRLGYAQLLLQEAKMSHPSNAEENLKNHYGRGNSANDDWRQAWSQFWHFVKPVSDCLPEVRRQEISINDDEDFLSVPNSIFGMELRATGDLQHLDRPDMSVSESLLLASSQQGCVRDIDQLLVEGINALSKDEFHLAISRFDHYLSLTNKGHYVALASTGYAYIRIGQWTRAIAALESALSIENADMIVRLNLALAYFFASEDKNVGRDIVLDLVKDDGFAPGWYAMSFMYTFTSESDRDLDRALQYLSKASQFPPQDTESIKSSLLLLSEFVHSEVDRRILVQVSYNITRHVLSQLDTTVLRCLKQELDYGNSNLHDLIHVLPQPVCMSLDSVFQAAALLAKAYPNDQRWTEILNAVLAQFLQQ